MKHLFFISLFFFLNNLIATGQYRDDGPIQMAQPYKKGTIITEKETIKDCYINEYFLAYQYIDYKLDSSKKETEAIGLKKVISVIIDGKSYIKVKGIVGGYGQIVKKSTRTPGTSQMDHNQSFSSLDKTSTVLTNGRWMVNILVDGKYSLGETLKRPIYKALMDYQKDKYVRGSILHIIKGDKNNGENYTEILGSVKKRKKKLKACFEGYPELIKMIDKIDFSKNGYTQTTTNQFIEIVEKYNSLQ